MLPDLFKRLKPLYGKRIDELWIAYNIGTQEEKHAIEEALTVLTAQRLGVAVGDEKITLEPPSSDVIGGGEYAIGTVSYPGKAPYPFTLYRRELLRHVFLLGPSGTGKSTLIIGLLRQLLRDDLDFWSVDFKRNYRCLLREDNGARLVVLTVGRETAALRLNMLLPPRGVESSEWVEALADIISSAYLLLQGARNVLKEGLLGAITAKGARATLRDALDLLRHQLATSRSGSRRYGWLESSYRSVEELTKGALGNALNATEAMTLEDLLGVPVVFELQGLGEDQKKAFCLFLLQAVLLLRKHQADAREVLRHALVFDEAHNVFPKEQWGQLGVPSKLAREVREYGEAIIAATQQADVADSLIANSGTKLILRTDYPKDVDFASKLLQVDARWLAKIPLGQGIARLPTRYYQPFLFNFAEQPLKNQIVPDSLVVERYRAWRGPVLLGEGMRAALAEANRYARDVLAGIESTAPSTVESRVCVLLRDIVAFPISTTRERYERLSWNPKTGTATKDDALRQGLIAFEVVKTLNAQIKILTLTDAGAALVGTSRARRFGGAAHAYWIEQCCRWLVRQGYSVVVEHPVGGGKSVDVYGSRGNERIIIEVETGKSDIQATLEKLQNLPGRRVLFAINEETRSQHRERASALGLEWWTPPDLKR